MARYGPIALALLQAYIRSGNASKAYRLARMMAHSARVQMLASALRAQTRALYASGVLPRFVAPKAS